MRRYVVRPAAFVGFRRFNRPVGVVDLPPVAGARLSPANRALFGPRQSSNSEKTDLKGVSLALLIGHYVAQQRAEPFRRERPPLSGAVLLRSSQNFLENRFSKPSYQNNRK